VPDYAYGDGDNIPLITAFLTTTEDGKTHVCVPGNLVGDPYDLTGCTAQLLVAPDDGTGSVDTRSVTIDPDQVANKGKVTFTLFSVGAVRQGQFNARVKVALPATPPAVPDRISFPNYRLMAVEVSPDPGHTP